MTDAEWSRSCIKVDEALLKQWLIDHPNNVTTLPLSTHRDNYGLVPGAKKAKSHDRAKWDSFQKAVR